MRSTNILRLSRSAARFEAEIPIGKATPKVSPVSQPQTSSASSTASSSSATAGGSPFTSAHRSYVKSLYKRTLKNELDWIVRRDIWRDRAIEVRAEVSEFQRAQCALGGERRCYLEDLKHQKLTNIDADLAPRVSSRSSSATDTFATHESSLRCSRRQRLDWLTISTQTHISVSHSRHSGHCSRISCY